MESLFTNGPAKDFVMGAYERALATTTTVFAASPFVTLTIELGLAAAQGKEVSLLVGLNVATNPASLRALLGRPNIAIRYYTHRFHAKVYLFDDCALVGSSNLTDGGMHSNREATVLLDQTEHLQQVRALCQELWSGAPVLTPDILKKFEDAAGPFGKHFNPDERISAAVGKAEPRNIATTSSKKSGEYVFLQNLRRRVYEQFKPAFDEVSALLSEGGLHRSEWSDSDRGSETNRFLNWVRLVHGAADEWQKTLPRTQEERRLALTELGEGWVKAENPRISESYFPNLKHLRNVFSSEQALMQASQEDLFTALMGVHAFEEQIRFIKGGYSSIEAFFWKSNSEDVARVKMSLRHLLFGKDEFILRLYEVLNLPQWKIAYFGENCALELTGTVNPAMCPPMNGRSAKALSYIGFRVPAS